jgi:mycoredoxin
MQITPRLLFTIAGVAFAMIVLWPGSKRDAVAEARVVVGSDRVVLFSAEWCGYCDRLRSDLTSAGIAFSELDIEASSLTHGAWETLGGRGVPVTLVGDDIVHGYMPKQILELARAAP